MTTTATTTDTITTTDATIAGAPSAATRLARGTGIGIALALAADVAVFALGNLGAPTRVISGWAPDGTDLRLSEVVVTAIVAVALGTACLWLAQRWRADGFRPWVAVAATVAVVSALPLLRLDIDAGSKVALVSMHLLTGVAAIAGHGVASARHRP